MTNSQVKDSSKKSFRIVAFFLVFKILFLLVLLIILCLFSTIAGEIWYHRNRITHWYLGLTLVADEQNSSRTLFCEKNSIVFIFIDQHHCFSAAEQSFRLYISYFLYSFQQFNSDIPTNNDWSREIHSGLLYQLGKHEKRSVVTFFSKITIIVIGYRHVRSRNWYTSQCKNVKSQRGTRSSPLKWQNNSST